MDDKKYYNFNDIMKFLNFAYFLKDEYPFNRNKPEDIITTWGTLIIPRQGIEDTIKARLAGEEKMPLNELTMLYQIPFVYEGKPGIINKNISLTFRYDKTYKYGDINKHIAECCYFIEKYSKRMNDFYILDNEFLFEFMSYYVIDNQWGLGSEHVSSSPTENLSCLADALKNE